MATSAAHARPELSKTESWKLTLGTWCVGDHPNDNEAYVGIARDQCGENEATLVIGENGYTWQREEGLSCRYSSGKARFDNTIAASTKTVGVWVFHIVAGCIRKASEGAVRTYTHSFDMYVSKGTLWIENLRSDKKPWKTEHEPPPVNPKIEFSEPAATNGFIPAQSCTMLSKCAEQLAAS